MNKNNDSIWEKEKDRDEKVHYAIQTRHLTKVFGRKKSAVNNLNLYVPTGAVFGFLGPNGSGKTTTNKLILGMLHPSAGEAFLFGQKMKPNSKDLRKRVGYLPTNPKFPPTMTPLEYLDHVGRIFQIPKEIRVPRVTSLLRSVDLLENGGNKIKTFSSGMTTRLGIAAALINDPELLILDEPTSGLDPVGRAFTIKLIKELGRTKTIFISSHILGDIENVCSHIGIITDGKLIFSGDMTELKRLLFKGYVTIKMENVNVDLEAKVSKIEEVEELMITRNELKFKVIDHRSMGVVIRKMLEQIEACGGEISDITTSTGTLEDAFIQLVEKEESNGFLRAYD